MIRLEGVTRRYRSAAGDRTALDAVDLHVARGEVCLLYTSDAADE